MGTKKTSNLVLIRRQREALKSRCCAVCVVMGYHLSHGSERSPAAVACTELAQLWMRRRWPALAHIGESAGNGRLFQQVRTKCPAAWKAEVSAIRMARDHDNAPTWNVYFKKVHSHKNKQLADSDFGCCAADSPKWIDLSSSLPKVHLLQLAWSRFGVFASFTVPPWIMPCPP